MTDHCDCLHPYLDGELDDSAAAMFEAHLATCRACSAELPRVLDLLAALDAATRTGSLPARISGLAGVRAAARGHEDSLLPVSAPDLAVCDVHAIGTRASAVAARAPRPARRRWLAAIAIPSALAAAAAVLLLVIARPVNRPPAPRGPSLAALDAAIGLTRPIEARVSLPGADRYRPIDVQRGGDDATSDSLLQLERDLEQAKDWHAAAVVALLAGDREHAARAFARAPASPELDSDRAAFELLDGSPPALERALDNVDHALAAAPRSAAAHWNRGLVLAALQLPMAAALEFDAVHALGEPGWASDAQHRAGELRAQVVQRRTRWKQAFAAGQRMIEDGTPAPSALLDVSGTMTYMLYDAVRAAPSRQRVLALLPVASGLDDLYRSKRLSGYVQRIATSDFRARKPLADRYRELALGRLNPEATAALLKQLTRAGAEDLRMGALVYANRVGTEIDDYRKLAAATADPWFAVIAEQAAAATEIAHGDTAAGEHRLREALALARRERLTYRAIRLENDLVQLHKSALELSRAAMVARDAYHDAIAAGEWVLEMGALNDLAAIHHNRYAFHLARAYLVELAERTEANLATGDDSYTHLDCARRMYIFQSLANISVLQHELERARAELAHVPRCDLDNRRGDHVALLLRNALIRLELYRHDDRPEDATFARDDIAGLSDLRTNIVPGQDAYLAYLQGALAIDGDPATGGRLLREAITKAGTDPSEFARKARVYSVALLSAGAARAGAFESLIRITSDALHVQIPDRCALTLNADGAHYAIGYIDAHGRHGGVYFTRTTSPLEADLARTNTPARLRDCARVTVFAQAPILGAAGLLPPDIAWSYQLAAVSEKPARFTGRRIVISAPSTPPELSLPALAPYPEEHRVDDVVILRGAEATPSRVLLAMQDAAVIEFHTHGFLADDLFEASHLVLSPDSGGHYTITADDIAHVQLHTSPLVILGACHAAAGSRVLEGGRGLPEAFLRSGARAVIASPETIQDQSAYAFFGAVRDRILQGIDPAIALRDERLRHLAERPDDRWVSEVVVFQ